jgi:hypothetical protein
MLSLDIDVASKLIQSAFYFTGGVIAVLTYLKAKNGLLNTINTEYHKKVIERLASVSEEIYREFDWESDEHWSKKDYIKDMVQSVHDEIVPYKERIINERDETWCGTPVGKVEQRMSALADKYRSDPFLPEEIRTKLITYMEERKAALMRANYPVFKKYFIGLAHGRYWDTLEENHLWIRNEIVDNLHDDGFNVNHAENKVHEIRYEIQKYFKKFNPLS